MAAERSKLGYGVNLASRPILKLGPPDRHVDSMLNLFDEPVVPGLSAKTEIVSPSEEASLIAAFNSIAFDPFFFGGGNVLTVYDGANGTGNVVYQGTFGQNCTPNCTAERVSVSLAGLGRSATLVPNANNTGIDNLSINAVPEPAQWALFIGGFALIGAAARRGRRSTALSA